MPAFNAEMFLREAVDSILNQTFGDFEFVIVDDCSTDATRQILEEYADRDSRVKLFRNEVNRGIAATRNRLMAEASPESDYFALMDADDIALPERFEKQLEYLEAHPELAAAGSSIWIIDEESRRIGRRDYPSDPRRITAAMIRFNPISQSSVMIRRSAVKATGLYNPKYRAAQDAEPLFDGEFAGAADAVPHQHDAMQKDKPEADDSRYARASAPLSVHPAFFLAVGGCIAPGEVSAASAAVRADFPAVSASGL